MRGHVIRVETAVIGGATYFVPVCACAWEGLPTVDKGSAEQESCGVFIAQVEGMQRRARRQARTEKRVATVQV